MTFDEDISETVSLSRILDCFIEENEKTTVIFSFLEKYNDSVKDIICNAKCRHRMFSLDFISKCSPSEINKIHDLIEEGNVDDEMTRYLSWQIMQSDIPEYTKSLFRKFITPNCSLEHPYHGRIGYEASQYDMIWKNTSFTVESVAEVYNRISIDKFTRVVKTLMNSLWVHRILQKDMFELLTPDKQWILVKHLTNILFDIEYFYRQMFSAKIDLSIKTELLKTFIDKSKKFIPWTKRFKYDQDRIYCKVPSEIKNEIDSAETYAQVAIKLTLFGMDNYIEDVVMYLMYNRRYDFLVSVLEYGRDVLENNYDICDLLEWMKNHLTQIR